jgi:hypothetical protein
MRRSSKVGSAIRKPAPGRLDRDRRLVEASPSRGVDGRGLIASYGCRAYRLAIGITGNRPDAEEVVQDALWMVVRKIDTFRGNLPLTPGSTASSPTLPMTSSAVAEDGSAIARWTRCRR